MGICCWRFEEDDPLEGINIEVKGIHTPPKLARKVECLEIDGARNRPLEPPPPGPIEHPDGGSPYSGGRMLGYESLQIVVTENLNRGMVVQIDGPSVRIVVPKMMLAELADQIAASRTPQLIERSSMVALLVDSSGATEEGDVVFWTWGDEGLVFEAEIVTRTNLLQAPRIKSLLKA